MEQGGLCTRRLALRCVALRCTPTLPLVPSSTALAFRISLTLTYCSFLSPHGVRTDGTAQTGQELAELWFGEDGDVATDSDDRAAATKTPPPATLFRHICEQAVDMALLLPLPKRPGDVALLGVVLDGDGASEGGGGGGERDSEKETLSLHMDAVSDVLELALDEFNPYSMQWSAGEEEEV